jgi:hypothetical protein
MIQTPVTKYQITRDDHGIVTWDDEAGMPRGNNAANSVTAQEHATPTPIDAFAAHLSECVMCRVQPRRMCEDGWRLMQRADVHLMSFPGADYDQKAACERIQAEAARANRFYAKAQP